MPRRSTARSTISAINSSRAFERDRSALGCGHGRLQTREHDLGDGQDDLVLGVVLVVDGRLRHAERVRDHLQRGPADAVLGKEAECGVDDAGLGGGVGR